MPAKILIADDVPANVRSLEVKFNNEYYNVVTAKDGFEVIEKAKKHKPDLILLGMRMPGTDGFETCEKLKEDPELFHTPIVMMAAVSEMSDRLRGLEAGADDFLATSVDDTALFARVKSLIRIKVLLEELRLRDKTSLDMRGSSEEKNVFTQKVSGSLIMMADDDVVRLKNISKHLSKEYIVVGTARPDKVLDLAQHNAFDLIILSTQLAGMDGLRLASQLKSQEATRNIPILVMVKGGDTRTMIKGFELGVNDYIVAPIDYKEISARVRTQIRRKKYQDALNSNYQQTLSQAITDELTGLYNRHYLNTHLDNMVEHAVSYNKPLSLMIMDLDHFKEVNDTYGHDTGDLVLKQLAELIVQAVRGADLAARFGGEEFVVLMPETNIHQAIDAAERIRRIVENTDFKLVGKAGNIKKTISVGVASFYKTGDSGQTMLKRADEALYSAKNGGRNKVVSNEN